MKIFKELIDDILKGLTVQQNSKYIGLLLCINTFYKKVFQFFAKMKQNKIGKLKKEEDLNIKDIISKYIL